MKAHREAKTCPHCGCVIGKERSPQHHRFYFKAIVCAFLQWPHSAEFKPQSAEHLRHWLQVQANHFLSLEGDPRDPEFIMNCMNTARKTGSSGFIAVSESGIVVKFPKSVSWDDLPQEEFAPIATAVFEIIEGIIGVPVDTLVRETRAAA